MDKMVEVLEEEVEKVDQQVKMKRSKKVEVVKKKEEEKEEEAEVV